MTGQQVNEIGKWLGIVTAIAAAGVSWGTNDEKIKQLEERMAQQTIIREDLSATKAQAARIDERTKALQESNKRLEVQMQKLIDLQMQR